MARMWTGNCFSGLQVPSHAAESGLARRAVEAVSEGRASRRGACFTAPIAAADFGAGLPVDSEAAVKGRVAGLGVLPSGFNREFADCFKLALRQWRRARGDAGSLVLAPLATDILCQGNGPSESDLSCLKNRK